MMLPFGESPKGSWLASTRGRTAAGLSVEAKTGPGLFQGHATSAIGSGPTVMSCSGEPLR